MGDSVCERKRSKHPPDAGAKTPKRSAEGRDKVDASPSCLDTTELSVEKIEGAAWLLDRLKLHEKLKDRLQREGRGDLVAILESCGKDFRLVCKDKGHLRLVKTHCKKRWCPLCAPMLAAERVATIQSIVARFQWPLIVNYTMSNVEDLSKATLRKLLRAFRKFRQRGIGKLMRGGFASLEISHTGNGWHPHVHTICDCEWLSLETVPPKRWWSAERIADNYQRAGAELSREWAQCIGQPMANVHIQRVATSSRAKKAAVEQIKYTLKGQDLVECEGEASEAIDAIQRVRLYRGFGSCYRLKLDEEVERTPCACEKCGCIQWEPEEAEQNREFREHKKASRRR